MTASFKQSPKPLYPQVLHCGFQVGLENRLWHGAGEVLQQKHDEISATGTNRGLQLLCVHALACLLKCAWLLI